MWGNCCEEPRPRACVVSIPCRYPDMRFLSYKVLPALIFMLICPYDFMRNLGECLKKSQLRGVLIDFRECVCEGLQPCFSSIRVRTRH